MNKTKLKAIAGILVVFVLGVALGVLGTGIYVRRSIRRFIEHDPADRHKDLLMERLIQELDLTEQQKPRVEQIVTAAQDDLEQFLLQSRQEFSAIMQRRNAQLKEILTPAQQHKLDEMFARMEKRWRRPPPPPTPDPDRPRQSRRRR